MITIYGKPGCDMCEKAKMKLTLMEFQFSFVDVTQLERWRDLNLVEFSAEANFRHGDGKPELPLILIDGRWFNYPEAIAWLRKN